VQQDKWYGQKRVVLLYLCKATRRGQPFKYIAKKKAILKMESAKIK
jgi:hypothetical protein